MKKPEIFFLKKIILVTKSRLHGQPCCPWKLNTLFLTAVCLWCGACGRRTDRQRLPWELPVHTLRKLVKTCSLFVAVSSQQQVRSEHLPLWPVRRLSKDESA